MNKTLITTLFLAAAMAANAGNGLDPASRARLRSLKSGFSAVQQNGELKLVRRAPGQINQSVGGFMTLNPGYTVADLADEPIDITETRSGMLLVRMKVDDVERIAALPAVANLRLEREVKAKMDKVRKAVGVDRLHRGEINSTSYTGKGVLCAAVDGGFDPNHVNFKNEDGTSRIQNFTYFRPIQGNAGYATENYGPSYMPNIDTENDDTFHGTHTLGIMAGGYRGKVKASKIVGDLSNPSTCYTVIEEVDNPYYGIAYGADIAVASGVTTDYYIAQGIEEILNFAWNRKMQLGVEYPVVINISMGSNAGPHDGSSYLAQYLDKVSDEDYTNNVICIAAGNEGELNISAHKTLAEGDDTAKTGLNSFDLFADEYPKFINGPIYVYSDSEEPFELQATVFNKKRGTVVFRAVAGIPQGDQLFSQVYYATEEKYSGEGDIISDQLAKYFTGYLGVISYLDEEESGRYFGVVDPLLWETKDNNGDYVIVVQAKGKPGQKIDFYTDGAAFEFGDLGLAEYDVMPGSTDGTIADTATGKNVVVVGSYNTRDAWASLDNEIYSYDYFMGNEVSSFSSWGTLVDGRELPHVCAPGATVISSTNEYYLDKNYMGEESIQAALEADGRRYSWQQSAGTSMSTPVVSGAIALWKEADPNLKYSDIIEIIRETAIKDADVTADPSKRVKWGAGKFDAFMGLDKVLKRIGIDKISDVTANPGNNYYVRSLGGKNYKVVVAGADRVDIKLYSLSGALVMETAGNSGEVTVDMSGMDKGVYLMNINGIYTTKVAVN